MIHLKTGLRKSSTDLEDPSVSQTLSQKLPQKKVAPGSTRTTWIIGTLLGIVAMGFNLYRLGTPSMWFDEILSVERSRQSLPVLLKIVTTAQANMAFYYFFLHFWLRMTQSFGLLPTEFVVRLPSAIFAALATIVVFLLGRRFIGTWGGIVAALLFLLNDLQLIYAQETRSYALELVLNCLAWYALFATLSQQTARKRWWACFIATMTIAVYSHLFSMLILFSQGIAVLGLLFLPTPWRFNVRAQFRAIVAGFGLTSLLIIPLILDIHDATRTEWIPVPRLIDITHLFYTITNQDRTFLALLVLVILLGISGGFMMLLPHGRALLHSLTLLPDKNDIQYSRLQQAAAIGYALLCWLIIPIVVSFVVSHTKTRLFLPRYLVTIVPPMMLLVGLGVGIFRWRLIQLGLTIFLIALALIQVPQYYRSAQVEDWNSTSAWIETHYQSNDGLVCYDNVQGCQVSMEYYFRAYPTAAHFDSDSPGYFPWVSYDTTNRYGNAGLALNPHALAVFGQKHPRLFFIVGRVAGAQKARNVQKATDWLNSHYQLIGQFNTNTVRIYLYDTHLELKQPQTASK
ncbi:MAG TPA: glycosyltransferase family 39 protein [Ktedonobacteraceae bacterium]|nr:glycosyltransferase family 39 protein [Ktedonobacteraceae bacterium]